MSVLTNDRVIFRVRLDTGDVIAFLPDSVANPGLVVSYMHVGQHSEADYYSLLSVTRPAKPAEYAALLKELQGIGYVLCVRRRLQR